MRAPDESFERMDALGLLFGAVLSLLCWDAVAVAVVAASGLATVGSATATGQAATGSISVTGHATAGSATATSPAGWAVGDVLEMAAVINVLGESGGAAPYIRIHGSNFDAYGAYQQMTDVTRGVVFTRFTIPTGCTSLTAQAGASSTVSGTGTFKIAQLSLYNLTRLGLV